MDQVNYHTHPVAGRDYSTPLRTLLSTLIAEQAMTVAQIAIAADREMQTVRRIIRSMHNKSEVYIASWQHNVKGPHTAAYMLGPGTDAKRPPIVSHAKKSKRWRNSTDGAERTRKYKKAQYARQKFSKGGIAAIDPLLAILTHS